MTPDTPRTSQQLAAITKLWHAGVLVWKLDEAQKLLHKEMMEKRGTDRMVLLASRGWGKSYACLLTAFEACLQGKKNKSGRVEPVQVAYITKTKKQARANLRQSAEDILADCPKAIRPVYLKNESQYEFANGSVLYLLGVDSERFDFIRGRALDGVIVDESQDIDSLDTVVRVVLDPCVLRREGWMLLAGTVPQRDTHDFVQFVREAQGTGHCVVKSILECPRYTPAQIEQWMKRAGGADSNIWKREYLCKMVFSDERAVIGEWTTEKAKELVQDLPRPDYAELYVGLDFGFQRDLTVAIFGYWDFAHARLVIEDELSVKGCTTATLAAAIEQKQLELWGSPNDRPLVHQFADGNEARTIYELRVLHKLRFRATDKKDKKMHINKLRILVAEGKLLVSPKCKLLIKTLFSATWNKGFNSYDRDAEIGHADSLDALLYLYRNVNQSKKPDNTFAHWTQQGSIQKPQLSAAGKTLAECFGGAKETDIRKTVAQKLARRRW